MSEEPSLVEQALEGEILISSVSFSSESIQIDYVCQSKQGENTKRGETIIIYMTNDKRQEYYFELMEYLGLMITECIQEQYDDGE